MEIPIIQQIITLSHHTLINRSSHSSSLHPRALPFRCDTALQDNHRLLPTYLFANMKTVIALVTILAGLGSAKPMPNNYPTDPTDPSYPSDPFFPTGPTACDTACEKDYQAAIKFCDPWEKFQPFSDEEFEFLDAGREANQKRFCDDKGRGRNDYTRKKLRKEAKEFCTKFRAAQKAHRIHGSRKPDHGLVEREYLQPEGIIQQNLFCKPAPAPAC